MTLQTATNLRQNPCGDAPPPPKLRIVKTMLSAAMLPRWAVMGNENSAQSFPERSFWKPLQRVVDVRAFGSWMSAPKRLFFHDLDRPDRSFGPGYLPEWPPDVCGKNFLFGLIFRSWCKRTAASMVLLERNKWSLWRGPFRSKDPWNLLQLKKRLFKIKRSRRVFFGGCFASRWFSEVLAFRSSDSQSLNQGYRRRSRLFAMSLLKGENP